jgi:hypothetical protein
MSMRVGLPPPPLTLDDPVDGASGQYSIASERRVAARAPVFRRSARRRHARQAQAHDHRDTCLLGPGRLGPAAQRAMLAGLATRSRLELAIVEHMAGFNNSRLREALDDRPSVEVEALCAAQTRTATHTSSQRRPISQPSKPVRLMSAAAYAHHPLTKVTRPLLVGRSFHTPAGVDSALISILYVNTCRRKSGTSPARRLITCS